MTRIAIAGAGIGGLAAALCLHEVGFDVIVYEAVRAIRPLGVGINVMPHGSRILHDLGLGEALDAQAIRTRSIEYRTRFGHLIQSDPRHVEAGFEAPQYSIHRGALQRMLLQAVQARLGKDAVRTGHRVTGYTQGPGGVVLQFEALDPVTADLVVGAEGLRSAIRAQMYPEGDPLRYEGTMMFRGAVETRIFGCGRTMIIAGDHDCKFVTYPISEPLRRKGRALTNWVAELRISAPRPLDDADWSRGATLDYLTPFKAFALPGMDLGEIMQATDRVTEFPMLDRDPLPCWRDGAVTLLGDAAHPMYPIGANGASQALQDARVLADCLKAAPGPDGLQAYEELRRPATSEVVLSNRSGGPEQVLDLAAARIRSAEDRIEDLISPQEVEDIAARYRTVAGFHKSVRPGPAKPE